MSLHPAFSQHVQNEASSEMRPWIAQYRCVGTLSLRDQREVGWPVRIGIFPIGCIMHEPYRYNYTAGVSVTA